jgi:hypothetical protein
MNPTKAPSVTEGGAMERSCDTGRVSIAGASRNTMITIADASRECLL